MPILEGGSFGSFLIMQKHQGTGALRKRLTKSVGFSDFIAGSKDVSVFMEPEFTVAEKLAIFEGMKNVHPPAPLLPPTGNSPKKARCDREISALVKRAYPLVRTSRADGAIDAVQQVYYLRSGKVDRETLDRVFEWLSSLPPGMLLGLDVHDEWVTDEVGGYRLVVRIERSSVAKHWAQNERVLGKKLPKD
jgi:hypothetical protein